MSLIDLHKICDESGGVRTFLKNLDAKIVPLYDEDLSAEDVAQRDNMIDQLETYAKIIEAFLTSVNKRRNKLIEAKESDSDDGDWATVPIKRAEMPKKFSDAVKKPVEGHHVAVPEYGVQPQPPAPKRIAITPALYVNAIEVPSIKHVQQPGLLYWIPHAGQFALKINDVVFSGNIGEIYDSNVRISRPTKIVNCKYGPDCTRMKDCTYYHNPFTCHGSKDKRNFFSMSFAYSPGNGLHNGRKFGALQSLDKDASHVTRDDAEFFGEQVMHDILCRLVLANMYK